MLAQVTVILVAGSNYFYCRHCCWNQTYCCYLGTYCCNIVVKCNSDQRKGRKLNKPFKNYSSVCLLGYLLWAAVAGFNLKWISKKKILLSHLRLSSANLNPNLKPKPAKWSKSYCAKSSRSFFPAWRTRRARWWKWNICISLYLLGSKRCQSKVFFSLEFAPILSLWTNFCQVKSVNSFFLWCSVR